MLTAEHKRQLKLRLNVLRGLGRSDSEISEALKKMGQGFNPATNEDIDEFLAEEGLPDVDGNLIHQMDEDG